jgi:hypothetical protein
MLLKILVWALLASTISFGAPPDEAFMKINGQATNTVSRDACTNPERKVEIILSSTALEKKNFKAYVMNVSSEKKDEKKVDCEKTLASHIKKERIVSFTKSNPHITQEYLLGSRDNACQQAEGEFGSRQICIYSDDDAQDTLVAQIPFFFDTRITILKDYTNIVAANGTITFDVDVSDGKAQKMVICYGIADANKIDQDGCPKPFKSKTQDLPTARLEGLDKNSTYSIKVKLADSEDKKENWLRLPDQQPVGISFPLSAYNGSGGELMYSCNSAPQAADLALLLLIFLLFLYRRPYINYKKYTLLLSCLCVISAQSAKADFGDMSFSILGSPYRPYLDYEKNSNNFYSCYFREKDAKHDLGPLNPLMGFDINWRLWDGLSLGLGASYAYVSGHGLKEDAHGNARCDDAVENYKVALHMYQIRPQITYELDHFVEYFPLFPYIRASFIAHGYSFYNGSEAPKSFTNNNNLTIKNNGLRFGWQAAAGLKLRLDFLEPSAVRSARSGGLFEHVYLLSELSYEKIDTFGRAGFQFSPKDIMGTKWPLLWTFGLAFDVP